MLLKNINRVIYPKKITSNVIFSWHVFTFPCEMISIFNKDSNEALPDHVYLPEYDSKKANLCPDCGRILIKYKVQPQIAFFVDHCGTCNGVWLDKCEWEELARANLHNNLNEFFTKTWQEKLKREMSKQRLEENYIKRF